MCNKSLIATAASSGFSYILINGTLKWKPKKCYVNLDGAPTAKTDWWLQKSPYQSMEKGNPN